MELPFGLQVHDRGVLLNPGGGHLRPTGLYLRHEPQHCRLEDMVFAQQALYNLFNILWSEFV